MAVTLDYSQAQPLDSSPVTLDFTKARPIPAPVTLDFTKARPLDPSDRFFTGAPGEIRAAQEPSVWDRITGLFNSRKPAEPGLGTSALTNAIGNAVPQSALPALAAAKRYAVDPLDRVAQAGANTGREIGREAVTGATILSHAGDYLNASMPSPYGPKPSVVSPEKLAEQEHPLALGVAGGVGSVVGSTAADVRNWPFFASSAARPILQRLIARGFATQMSAQTYQGAKELYDRWDKLSPTERAEIGTKTGVGALFAAKGIAEGLDTQTHSVDPTSPLGRVLAEPAPSVRVADNAVLARDLIEADTVLPEARVTGPSGIAELRNPTARVVSDAHIPVISQDEVLAHAISNVLNNSAELRSAGVDLSSIKTNGDIDAALMRASDLIKSNLDPRAYNTLSFETQKALAADLGMTVEELLSRRQGQAYNTEESLAARALLNQSAQHVIELSKIAAQSGDATALKDATTALAQHKAIQETAAGVRAEAGRALGGYRIDNAALPEVKISNILSKLSPKAQAQAIELLSRLDPADPQTVRRVNQFVEQVTPRTTLEKLHEIYRNALLSSPHTLIVKTSSEASMAAMTAMQKAVAGGIAKFKDSPDRFAAESWYYAKGMAQALAEHAKPILSGEFQLEGSPGFERAGTQAIKGPVGSVVRAPSEAMSRMTNLLYAGNFFGELNSLAARQAIAEGLDGDAFHARQEYLSHLPTEEMQESAHDLATRNTFQSQLGPIGEKIGQAIATKPTAAWLPASVKTVAPLKWLLPFYRTPVNLFKATITHGTPYELLNGIAKGDTDAHARGIVGSSIAAALAAAALSGHITGGGPTDFRKEETKRATGWQPYSVKIGDRYYSYRRFEPVGLAAGLIADTVHGSQSGDSEVVAQSKADTAVKHIMRNLDDFPFLSTVANLLQAIHDPVGGRAQSFINREAGSLVPAAVANVAETIDPTVRRPQSAMQAIESRIPGLTSAAPAIIDVTGHEVQRPFNNLGGANPFPFTTAKHDPVVDELARLGISTPTAPQSVKWRGKPTPLTDAERRAFAQQEGQELYRRVGKLIQGGAWQKRTDDQKRRALVELHRMLDEARPARLTKMRKQTQTELARSSL